MLSDEEKKAIKVVNKRTERLIEELKIEEEDLIDEPKIAYLITQIEANKTLLNLIEKQSKEIEELNFKYQARKDRTKQEIEELKEKISETYEYFKRDFTPNDKIKAKIEERKNFQDKFDECNMMKDVIIEQNIIQVLQSLLEKE